MPLFIKLLIIFLSLFISVQQDSYAKDTESKLKAAYLASLGEFITWSTSNTPQDLFSICISSNDPINRYLQEIFQYSVQNKPLKIINPLTTEQFTQCQIVYIGSTQLSETPLLLKSLANKSILTVSSLAEFAKRGGNIEFYIKNNKVRMRINLNSSKKAGLMVSSKLLRLMEIIEP